MRRLLVFTLVVLSISLIFALQVDLSIIHTSDLHGNIFPVDYATGMYSDVGLAKISTFLNQVRSANPNVIAIDTGDLIQGTPLAYYYAKINRSGENPMITTLNHMNFAASVVGNHEFNYGPAILEDAIATAHFPILSANIVFEDTGDPAFEPYTIVEIPVDGHSIRVGIIGLTTSFIPNWEEPANIAGLDFVDPVNAAGRYVSLLRGIVDVLILAYHGGFERDLITGLPTEELVRENVGFELLSDIDGIDVLLTGHQHRTIAEVINGVGISQPSNWGRMVGKIDISLEKVAEGWKILETKVVQVSMADYAADEEILEMTGEFENSVQQWLDRPVGFAIGDFYIDDPFLARLADNTLMEFINRIQMEATGARISSVALFTNDIKGWKTGPVTIRNINAVYIYPNTLKVLKVTGSDIKAALEKSAEYFTFEKGEVKVTRSWIEPKPRHYNYDMWEGIDYVIAVDRPIGDRVLSLRYMGQPVIMDAEYEIVLNNYRASGGGGYTMFQGKPVVREVMLEMAEIIADYVMERVAFSATLDRNWSVGTGSVHIVGWNETIRTIAQMYEMEPSEIMKYNPDLKGLVRIPPGTRVIIYRPFLSEIPVI
jgi:2',3'-cyclic-nucleotide 2'-phosphodiesterase/3'-nucleotidase